MKNTNKTKIANCKHKQTAAKKQITTTKSVSYS